MRLHKQGLPTGAGAGQFRPQELALRSHVVVGEQDGLALGKVCGQPLCVGAGHVVFVVIDHGSQISPGQHGDDGQRGDLQPDVQAPVQRLGQFGRLAPLPVILLAGKQQQVSQKISDAQRA